MRDILFTSGSLSNEDKSWDIMFWQTVNTEERYLATSTLIKTAYELQNNTNLPMSIDKTYFISGSYNNTSND